MNKVCLARIDERLLHGQVIVNYLPLYDIKNIILLDDEIAKDEFLTEITKSVVPDGVNVIITSEIDAYKNIKDVECSGKIMILTKNITTIYELLNKDIIIEELNLGGMSMKKSRKKYLDYLAMSSEDMKILQKIDEEFSTDVYAQMVPNSKKNFLKNIK